MTDTTETTASTSWEDKVAKLRARKPRELTIIIGDDEAQAGVVTARLALHAAQRDARRRHDGAQDLDDLVSADDAVRAAEADLAAATEAAVDAGIEWTFRALPPDVYDTFALDYPPTPEQEKLGMEYDPKGWVPAIIAACSTQPIAVEVVTELCFGNPAEGIAPAFNQGEVGLLAQTCRDVNQRKGISLGKASRPTRS